MKRLLVILFAIFVFSGCPPKRVMVTAPDKNVMKNIYETVKGGQIDICLLGTDSVYKASRNAFDAPIEVFSYYGKTIGMCNYAFNLVDSICGQLKHCRVIYRGRNHITGEAFVDEYNLEIELE